MGRVSSWLTRAAATVTRPTQAAVRGWALAPVIANAVLIATGEAVRLSSSGLGCPDWPTCTQTSLVAAHSVGQTSLNTAIEFGNRTLTYPLVIISGLAFIACLRYRPGGHARRDLVWLSAALPLGVIAQAVVGGIVVLTTSTRPVWRCTTCCPRRSWRPRSCCTCGSTRGRGRCPLVRTDLRVLTGLLVGATALMLAAGTVVTGTGPLAGTTIDVNGHHKTVPRFHFTLENVTQLHADIGWFIGALAVAVVIGLRFSGRAARRGAVRLAGPGGAGPAGRHRVCAVLQPPARRAGVGAREHVGAAVDLRAAAVPGHQVPGRGWGARRGSG